MWKLDHKESWALEIWCWCWRRMWCWRRLLRVPWTARRSNQLILKEINTEYSLEGLMLKLKLQYLGHLMWKSNSLEKTLMLGKTEGRRRWERQKMRRMDGITDLMDMSLRKFHELVMDWKLGVLQCMGSQSVRHDRATGTTTTIQFSTVALSIYIPTSSSRGFPFLHILSSIYCL